MAAANEINAAEKGLTTMCDGTVVLYGSTLDRNDPFNSENNGTAKFLGSGTYRFDYHTMKAANSSSKVSLPSEYCYCLQGTYPRTIIPSEQRSLRAEFSKNELLNMLCFLEGELQAREVVIAALKNDRVKHLLHMLQTKTISMNDPHAALFRDKAASSGNLVSRQSSATAVQAEMEVRAIIEQQMDSLYQMVTKQRATQVRMVKVLTESLENNQRMRQELEEEKRKHEHDTAQGDDITYGLEMERTKLKQELESEKTNRKKLEKDFKKLQETLDYERDRQKQIVLLLLAERKKIIMKYVEERKRSEDLAQILSEEKQRSDTIAEGLEEESKKSLRMEAELEKQTLTIENERKAMKINLAKEEKRIKELEMELAQLRSENEVFRKQTVPLRIQSSHNVPAPTLPAKIRSVSDEASAAAQSSMVNVAKIVQPTATVSSVPVSGPTTGIARSISPGQSLRQQATAPSEGMNAPPAKVTPRKLSNPSSSTIVQQQPTSPSPLTSLTTENIGEIQQNSSNSLGQQQQQLQQQQSSTVAAVAAATTAAAAAAAAALGKVQAQVTSTTAAAAASINLGKVQAQVTTISGTPSTTSSSPIILTQQQTATILRGASIGGQISTLPASTTTSSSSSTSSPSPSSSSTSGPGGGGAGGAPAATAVASLPSSPATSSSSVTSSSTTPSSTKSPPTGGGVGGAVTSGGRGVPPPIPPNKPIIPPKREPSISRWGPITTNNSNYI